MGARIALPLTKIGRNVRPTVERHNARIVDEFCQKRHMLGGLEEMHVVVVGRGQQRWRFTDDATFVGVESLRAPILHAYLAYRCHFGLSRRGHVG